MRRAPRRPPRPRWRYGGSSADGCGSRPKLLDREGRPARVPLGSRRSRGSPQQQRSPRLGRTIRQRSAGSSEGQIVALWIQRSAALGTVARWISKQLSTTRSIGPAGRVCWWSARPMAPRRPSPRRGRSRVRTVRPSAWSSRSARSRRSSRRSCSPSPLSVARRGSKTRSRVTCLPGTACRVVATPRSRSCTSPRTPPDFLGCRRVSSGNRFATARIRTPVSPQPGYSRLSRRPAYALAQVRGSATRTSVAVCWAWPSPTRRAWTSRRSFASGSRVRSA